MASHCSLENVFMMTRATGRLSPLCFVSMRKGISGPDLSHLNVDLIRAYGTGSVDWFGRIVKGKPRVGYPVHTPFWLVSSMFERSSSIASPTLICG
jgi:hypothetical protein